MIPKPSLVSVVDDDESIREALPDLLRQFGLAAETFASAEAFLASEFVGETSCLLLDVAMPGRSGLDVLKEVKREQRRLPVLVTSMVSADHYGTRVLKAGASGYVNKESTPEDLIQAIQKVMSGGRYVSPALADRGMAWRGNLTRPRNHASRRDSSGQ